MYIYIYIIFSVRIPIIHLAIANHQISWSILDTRHVCFKLIGNYSHLYNIHSASSLQASSLHCAHGHHKQLE